MEIEFLGAWRADDKAMQGDPTFLRSEFETMDAVNNYKANVAVIGGGIFGSTTAIKLAQDGFKVTLLEREKEIMSAASAINQYRLHKGYHYPRSMDTTLSCIKATPQFEKEYAEAVIDSARHYYAIAKERSLVSAEDYLAVLDEAKLSYQVVEAEHINPDAVAVCVEVEENLYDPYRLKDIVGERLSEFNVDVKTGCRTTVAELGDFDFVVAATYASLNESLQGLPEGSGEYQYEVCEKIVIEPPEELRGISTVVMDGPFMSFDPLGTTNYAVMGHVEHAIHLRSFGEVAEIPDSIQPLLNRGVIENPEPSKAHLFLEEGAYFMPSLSKAKHVGSMYTTRMVLPQVASTDARPTLVNLINDRVVTIFSGKVGNCVAAAADVVALFNQRC